MLNYKDEGVGAKEWDATFDSATCPTCSGLDGEQRPLNESFSGGFEHPPAHANCRCAVMPVVDESQIVAQRERRETADNRRDTAVGREPIHTTTTRPPTVPKKPTAKPTLERTPATEKIRHKPIRVARPQGLSQAEIERRLTAPLPREIAYEFDSTGALVRRKRGARHSVSFTQREIGQMKGHTLIHNHPNGASFSFDDARMLVNADLKEMRAITERYRYSLSVKAGARAPSEAAMRKAYDAELKRAITRTAEDVRDGRLALERAAGEAGHDVWSRIADNLNLVYRREVM